MNVLRKAQGCRAVCGSSHTQGWIPAAERTDSAASPECILRLPGTRTPGAPCQACPSQAPLQDAETDGRSPTRRCIYAGGSNDPLCFCALLFPAPLELLLPHRWRWQSLYIICSVWVRSVSWFHWKKKKMECAKWFCSYCFFMISRRRGEKCWLTKLCLHWCSEAFKFQTLAVFSLYFWIV